MDKLAESIIVDIVQKKLDLPIKNVWISNQNKKIPNDTALYVVVGMMSSYPISCSSRLVTKNNKTYEVTEGQLAQQIQIDIASRSDESITRKHEIIMALNSIYAKQQQEKYVFKIERLPNSFVNTSYAEGGSQLNRFSLTFTVLSWFRKEEALAPQGGLYYDDFKTRVDDAESIETPTGIIEFEITPQ